MNKVTEIGFYARIKEAAKNLSTLDSALDLGLKNRRRSRKTSNICNNSFPS